MKQTVFNPYLPPWEYVPDGEPHVFDDRLYLFGSHDRFGGEDFCLNDYVCWSAPVTDLSDWRFDGVIYRRDQDPDNAAGKMYLYAPDVCRGPDGRYYLYYSLNLATTVGVAVADRPEGPYDYYGHVKHPDGTLYGKKKGDNMPFDPAVFVDDDQKVYLYTGFGPEGPLTILMNLRAKVDGGHAVQLADDMLTICSEVASTVPKKKDAAGTSFEGHAFFEASSLRKVKDQYYFIYSSEWGHELCYATGETPMGPFTFGGTLYDNGDVFYHGRPESRALDYTGNNHGSIVQVDGQWYVFGHRQTNRHLYSRQGVAEKIEIADDGSIAQVERTSCGLNDGPLPGTGRYGARIACNLSSAEGTYTYVRGKTPKTASLHPYFTQSGADREEGGDQYIANMRDGAFAGFKYFSFDQENRFTLRYRCTGKGRVIVTTVPKKHVKEALADGQDQVRTQGLNPQMCQALLPIEPSEGWTEVSADFNPMPGEQALYLMYLGEGALDLSEIEMS